MPEPNPTPVVTVPDVRFASVLVGWLVEKGIPADIRAEIPKPTVDALTGATQMADVAGVEVVVNDPARVEEAKQLIADRVEEVQALHAKREARAAREGTVTAVCEECGKSSDWPAAEMGTTQDCPHCTAFMDIPDPDDDWADLDVGDEDRENEAE